MKKTVVLLVLIKMAAAENAEGFSVVQGGTVELKGEESALRGAGPVARGAWPETDVRWTGPGLVLHRNRTVGCGGRCELLRDGALRLRDARLSDQGQYRQEVYDLSGRRLERKDLTLTILGQTDRSQVGSKVWIYVGLSLVLVLLFITTIVIYIRRRRRGLSAANQSRDTEPRPLEENIYVSMFRTRDLKIQATAANQSRDTSTAANQSRDTEFRCLEENPYVPMFRARDLKIQPETKTMTETKTETEEDVYV